MAARGGGDFGAIRCFVLILGFGICAVEASQLPPTLQGDQAPQGNLSQGGGGGTQSELSQGPGLEEAEASQLPPQLQGDRAPEGNLSLGGGGGPQSELSHGLGLEGAEASQLPPQLQGDRAPEGNLSLGGGGGLQLGLSHGLGLEEAEASQHLPRLQGDGAPEGNLSLGIRGPLVELSRLLGLEKGNLSLGSDGPLVELSRSLGLESAQVHVELAASDREPGYAFEKYPIGQPLEGRMKNGSWVPVVVTSVPKVTSYDVHVADDYPGYQLPQTPCSILRRPQVAGQADYLVDNSELNARGLGLKYRHSKDVEDKSDEYAPWGTLIMGEDQGDGWVKVSAGYVPFVFRNKTVLVKRPRKGEPDLHKDPFPSVEDPLLEGEGPTFNVGEPGEFRSRGGHWYKCYITAASRRLNTYNIIVPQNESFLIPVLGVKAERLRRTTPLRPRHPQPFPPPSCGKNGEGCVRVRVSLAKSGKHFLVQTKKASRFDAAMRIVCTKLKIDWESCQTKHTFRFKGELLRPWSDVELSGLEEAAQVVMQDAAPSSDDA